VDNIICNNTFLKPLNFQFSGSSDILMKRFEVFCPFFLNLHANSLAIPIYFLHSFELKQKQKVWVKAWLRPKPDASVICWREASEVSHIPVLIHK